MLKVWLHTDQQRQRVHAAIQAGICRWQGKSLAWGEGIRACRLGANCIISQRIHCLHCSAVLNNLLHTYCALLPVH